MTRRKTTTTRLLQALKAKLSGTDIQRKAQEFADKQKLELDNVIDAERTVAGGDMTPDQLQAYRLLVGSNNVRRAKIAADLIKQGKAVPAPILQAFSPIAKIIDDITSGGTFLFNFT